MYKSKIRDMNRLLVPLYLLLLPANIYDTAAIDATTPLIRAAATTASLLLLTQSSFSGHD